MKFRVTIRDIADRLGTTPNTVSKALRGLPGVSEQLRSSIFATAKEIGYVPNQAARILSTKPVEIGIVYPRRPIEFEQYLEIGWEQGVQVCSGYQLKVNNYVYDSLSNGLEAMHMLRKAVSDGADGIIAHLGFNLENYRAALEDAVKAGIPILQVSSGCSVEGQLGQIQLNPDAAGALAAEFLSHSVQRSRDVVILVGNRDFETHAKIIDSFSAAAERYQLNFMQVYEAFEDSAVAYFMAKRIMQSHPILGGIYISSYNSDGCSRWFREHPDQERPVMIGQDLYPALVNNLKEGFLDATLYQNQQKQARNSLIYMVEYLTGLRSRDNCSEYTVPQLLLRSHMEFQREFI